MKIEFLTQDDPLYILPFFEEFLRNYASVFEVLQVSCCRIMGRRSRSKLLLELLHLYGAAGFLRIVSRAALKRILGMLPGWRSKRSYSLKQLCHHYNIRLQTIENPHHANFLQAAKQRASDIIVSVACPYILKEPLLSLAPRGCINIHHAPLPRYKGMMPTFWQMYHGEKEVGVTIHYMAAKVDEGDALLQEMLPIRPGETLDHLIRRSKRHGAHCMAQVLRQIASRSEVAVKLDNATGSYFTFPTLQEMKEFYRRGCRAI